MDLRTTSFTIFSLLVRPFSDRLRLGEGGLIIFNLAHSIASRAPVAAILIETLVSFLVLCVLYGYNDYVDAEKDLLNPKKDKDFIEMILSHRVLFKWLIILVNIATIAAAWVWLRWQTALCIVLLYVINLLYSLRVKSIPLADIVIVSLWGGLYVCISGVFHWQVALAAGLMVGIAHFFQIVTDHDTDSQNSVQTSAVAMRGWEASLLFILCAILTFVIYLNQLSPLFAVLGVLPFVFFISGRRVTFSWYASRVVFFVLWLGILSSMYAAV
ncbi:MAG: UbiA family prenyltransferase [Bacteroidetes bacterium]|nr:UbiA family prenyltransferase [Bacteroidota bacterium]